MQISAAKLRSDFVRKKVFPVSANILTRMNARFKFVAVCAMLGLQIGFFSDAQAHSGSDRFYPSPSPLPTYPAVIFSSKYSVKCRTESSDEPLSAPIYSYSSIGRPDFPVMDKAYIKILREIYAKMDGDRKKLRFTYDWRFPKNNYHFNAFSASQKDACYSQELDFLTADPIYKYNNTLSPTNAVIDNGGSEPYPWPVVAHPKFRRVGKYGIACEIPDSNRFAAPTYKATDNGKPGVPRLRSDELKMIRRIQKYLPVNELRFAILDRTDVVKGMPQGRIVVFRSADSVVCANSYAFSVLNQPILSKYDSLRGFYTKETMSGMFRAPQFPWNHPETPFPLETPFPAKFRSIHERREGFAH